jgi:hypothetical protein
MSSALRRTRAKSRAWNSARLRSAGGGTARIEGGPGHGHHPLRRSVPRQHAGDLGCEERAARATHVPRARERRRDGAEAASLASQPSRTRDRPLLVLDRNEVNAILGEGEAVRDGPDALAPRALRLERSPGPYAD